MKPALLVSACLLGVPCRYDGQSKRNEAVCALAQAYRLIPVCPEVLGGLPTPRAPSERLGERVVTRDGRDVTQAYQKGAAAALALAQREGCRCAVLKERSPACGCGEIYDGSVSHTTVRRDGVAAQLLRSSGLFVCGESQICTLT